MQSHTLGSDAFVKLAANTAHLRKKTDAQKEFTRQRLLEERKQAAEVDSDDELLGASAAAGAPVSSGTGRTPRLTPISTTPASKVAGMQSHPSSKGSQPQSSSPARASGGAVAAKPTSPTSPAIAASPSKLRGAAGKSLRTTSGSRASPKM